MLSTIISTFLAAVDPGAGGAGGGGSSKDVNLGTFEPVTDAYSKNSTTQTGVLENLDLFVSNLIGFLTVLASLFFIVYFFTAAFKWITAGGDSSKVQKARDQMFQGAMGLVVIVSSYAVVGLIGSIIGLGNIFDIKNQIKQILPSKI